MKKSRLLFIFGLLITLSNAVQAVRIFDDKETFISEVGSLNIETFNDQVDGTEFHSTPLDVGPFTISMTGSPDTYYGRNTIDASPESEYDVDGSTIAYVFTDHYEDLILTFDTPIKAFGVDLANFNDVFRKTVIAVARTSNLPVVIEENVRFFGITSDEEFDTVKFVGATPDAYGMDNVLYVAASVPAADIEKLTNGSQSDGAHDPDVPRLAPGATVTWRYEVTNTGGVALSEADIIVTDSQPGVDPVLNVATDDGDMILSPGETWTYIASAQAEDLTNPPAEVTIVPGCNDNRNTYENTGRVEIAGTTIFDEDLSHYCNATDTDGDGIADNEDNCIFIPNGPLVPDAGGNSQLDTNGDSYGNICDPDFDANLSVDFYDLAYLKSRFFTSDPDADLDGNGTVDFADLAILKSMFFGPPGPSGLTP